MKLHLLRIDPAIVPLHAVVTKPGHVEDIVRGQHALFGLNANFFDEGKRPLGVVVENRKSLNGPHPSIWMSIFRVRNDGKPEIILASRWNAVRANTRLALQAGPRLVIGRKLTSANASVPTRRSGVCIQGSHRVVFFVTPGDRFLTVGETARLAQGDESLDGIGCRDAMLFDGGPSTQLYMQHQKFGLSVFGDTVPAFIVAGTAADHSSRELP